MDATRQRTSILHQAHPWHGVSPGDKSPDMVTVFIELVPTDTNKYELDKESGHLWLDRPQRFSSMCPTPYGFIPRTYCGAQVADICNKATRRTGIEGDGDPLDVCVLTDRSLLHNLLLSARPIGGLRMIDGDEADDKIIAVLENDHSYGAFNDIIDCPGAIIQRLMHYFLSYKQLPGKHAKVEITGTYGCAEAHDVIRSSIADYQQKFPTIANAP